MEKIDKCRQCTPPSAHIANNNVQIQCLIFENVFWFKTKKITLRFKHLNNH
jgi:hypothetical protein